MELKDLERRSRGRMIWDTVKYVLIGCLCGLAAIFFVQALQGCIKPTIQTKDPSTAVEMDIAFRDRLVEYTTAALTAKLKEEGFILQKRTIAETFTNYERNKAIVWIIAIFSGNVENKPATLIAAFELRMIRNEETNTWSDVDGKILKGPVIIEPTEKTTSEEEQKEVPDAAQE